MAEQYLSFDEVMRVLGISQDELEQYVGDGRLRAFRVSGETKFKKSDVDELAHLATEDTFIPDGDIELADDAADDLLDSGTEEIVFDDDIDDNAVTAEFDADDATTQELSLDDAAVFDDEGEIATEAVDLEGVEFDDAPASSRRRASVSRRIAEFPIDKPPVWVSALLVATVVFLLIAGAAFFQSIKYNEENSTIPGHLRIFTDALAPDTSGE